MCHFLMLCIRFSSLLFSIFLHFQDVEGNRECRRYKSFTHWLLFLHGNIRYISPMDVPLLGRLNISAAFWILDAGFQMIPVLSRSHFLSVTPLPSTDVTIIEFFIVLLFLQLFALLPCSLLLCFFVALSRFCTYYKLSLNVFFLLYFQWWMGQQLVFFYFNFISVSLSFLPHFFVLPSTHLFLVLPVVNMLISSSGGGREERRLNCRMANNCTALIAILNSVFRNNQIRESVSVYAVLYECLWENVFLSGWDNAGVGRKAWICSSHLSSVTAVKDSTAADFA